MRCFLCTNLIKSSLPAQASIEAAEGTLLEGSGDPNRHPASRAIRGASLGRAKQQRPHVRQQVKGVDGVHHSDPNSCAAKYVPVIPSARK